jgi:hypothetical protein
MERDKKMESVMRDPIYTLLVWEDLPLGPCIPPEDSGLAFLKLRD